MHRIDTPSAAPGNLFTEGNPGLGVPATEVSADFLNAIQEEVCAVVAGASIALNKSNNAQLLAAIGVLLTRLVPAGIVAMWSGSSASIPAGWRLCDGGGGTPDLRDRFVVGAGPTHVQGTTGGASSGVTNAAGAHSHTLPANTGSHALTVSELPAHTHDMGTEAGGTGNYHTPIDSTGVDEQVTGNPTQPTGGGEGHSHPLGGSTSDADTHSHTVATEPPWYALCYVMKV